MCSTQKQKCNDQNKYTQDNDTENKGHRLKAPIEVKCDGMPLGAGWLNASRSSRLPPLWVLSGSLRTAIRVEPRTIVSV